MSLRWPGWRTLLPGIEIAPLAEKARAQGEPVKHYSYVWGPDEHYVATCGWQVDADGTVSALGEGWEVIIEDGMLTGVRGIKGGTVEKLVQVTTIVIPEGEPPWSPALTVRLPPEQIGRYRLGDSMTDGIEVDNKEPLAAVSVGFTSSDGSHTFMTWGITSESAASVIALIRARHGEPLMEATADAGSVASFHEAAMAAFDHTVFTCMPGTESEPRP